jgi:FkbM family methyltransferase
MRRLIFKLSRSAFARNLARHLQFTKIANWWLKRHPVIRQVPDSTVVYRATRLESIPLAVEMFEKNLYEASLLPEGFSTFADLGCNVGYFTCWLGHLANDRKIKGLMIDANPEAVQDAQWHASANSWTEVFGLNGVVGCLGGQKTTDFYVYESNICSTTSIKDIETMGLKGKWTKISVPCLQLGPVWREKFGDSRCHLLKIDIEGAELDFLRAEPSFLRQVDSILVEWHKWRVTLDDVNSFLRSQGFTLIKILEESAEMGTAFFLRKPPETGRLAISAP